MNSLLLDHIEKLMAFRTVADAKSFRKAATIAHKSQPSISRSIQTLESILDCQLFFRTSGGVELTPSGFHLYELTRTIFAAVQTFHTTLKDPTSSLVGVLKAGTYEYLIKLIWSKVFLEINKDFPKIELSLCAKSGFITQKSHLENGLDLIVDVEPFLTTELNSVTLFEDHFRLYSAFNQRPIDADVTIKLGNSPLIYVPSAIDDQRITLQENIAMLNIRAERIIEVDTFESARHLAVAGIGVAILPVLFAADSVSKKELSSTSLSPSDASGFGKHKVCATFRKSFSEDPRLKVVVQLLVEQASKLKA